MIPLYDSRDYEDLIKKIKALYPHYIPEASFSLEEPDAGTALAIIFAKMFSETVKRFNKVPLKNYIAFLNMLNVNAYPALPSEAVVTFKLSEGAKNYVFIPSGTKVSAENTNELEAVDFETSSDMLATPATPTAVFVADSKGGAILNVPDDVLNLECINENVGFKLFDFTLQHQNLQEHNFLLSHPDMFDINQTAFIELEIINSKRKYKENEIYKKLSDKRNVEWFYLSESENGETWVQFDRVEICNGILALVKEKEGEILRKELNGLTSNWIKCCLKGSADDEYFDIEWDNIKSASKYLECNTQSGFLPDMMFYNDIELNNSNYYPFGNFFGIYDTFYLSSKEALSKRGAIITINIDLEFEALRMQEENKGPINYKPIMRKTGFNETQTSLNMHIEKVIWEYWDGNGWVKLFSNEDFEEVFNGCRFKKNNTQLKFECPLDIQPTTVNNHDNFWIRARVLVIQNAYCANGVFITPRILSTTLKYEYAKRQSVESILTYNNLEWKLCRVQQNNNDVVIKPFKVMDNTFPAFFIGFDVPPLKGPINIYFSIERGLDVKENVFQTMWEYYGVNGWSALKFNDYTDSFTTSGIVTFVGPSDFHLNKMFGRELYWIRVQNKGMYLGDKVPGITIRGIYMNTVKALQQESIYDEIPEMLFSKSGAQCRLSRFPVLSEEVWVNEERHLSDKQKKDIQINKKVLLDIEKDEFGNITSFWVKWNRVEDFLHSGSEDRDYIIDQSTGDIFFGNGEFGRALPKSQAHAIKVNYKVGGGRKGNVPALSINTLHNSIAYIDKVFNCVQATGGCDMETLEEAMNRGPAILKHRNRAVTAEDFERLALQASRNISKVKCLSNFNGDLKKETGCVTLVIVPKSETFEEESFLKLKTQVKKHVLKNTSNLVAFNEKIDVIEPVYIEITVNAELVVEEMDYIIQVEKSATERLDLFLHHLKGNFNNNGWKIGEYPHISNFFTLLKSIRGVRYVENIIVSAHEIRKKFRKEISINMLEKMPYCIIKNGEHTVNVKYL